MADSKMTVLKATESDIQTTQNWESWSKEVSVFKWEYDET
jgi:hypothetical protein